MTMPATELITKEEALRMLNGHINKPGVIDVNALIEMLTWQTRLTLLLLQDETQREQRPQLKEELLSQLALLEYARKH